MNFLSQAQLMQALSAFYNFTNTFNPGTLLSNTFCPNPNLFNSEINRKENDQNKNNKIIDLENKEENNKFQQKVNMNNSDLNMNSANEQLMNDFMKSLFSFFLKINNLKILLGFLILLWLLLLFRTVNLDNQILEL